MKNENPLTKLMLLLAVLLTLSRAQAQADILRPVSIGFALTRTNGAAQQNQALAPSTPQASPQVQYMVIELGGRTALNISESGQIVGSKVSAPELIHAAFWASSRSAPIDLGTLPGLNSVARGINPRREIVGFAFNEDFSVERPLFWASPNSAPVELPGLPAGLAGEVYDINPSGQIVGQFFNADFSVNPAVFWPNSNAAPIYLHVLSNKLFTSVATSINASGNILGDACDQAEFECHAVFWANSTSTPVALASPGGGFIYSFVVFYSHGINGAGNMVGYAYTPGFAALRAVFWASSSSPAVILSTVSEFTNTVAAGISDNGQIVGYGYNEDFSRSHPFIWPSATSQGIDLTTFFPAGSNWDLDSTFAIAVNNRGEIIGGGSFNDGTFHNFVLIPVHGH